MNELLLKLFIAAALLDFGHALLRPDTLSTRSGLERIDHATRQVLKIDWKPISVFPEEAKKFK
ncbi:MAG: hypothetical protein ACK5Y2_00945 [Bdellovibrionales bacterium]